MRATKDVLDNHLKCFGEGDLKGILSDYARGAVLFTPNGPLKGVDSIRPLFEQLLADIEVVRLDLALGRFDRARHP